MNRLGACAAGLGCLAAACSPTELPPLGEVVIHVDTDAPLRPAAGELGPDDPLPLFDRLRIDVVDPRGACDGCTREFDVFASDEPLSFGLVLPPHRTGFVARARLFQSVVDAVEPRADSSIDVTFALPAVDDEGTVDARVFLPTDAVAKPMGSLDAPLEPELGKPAASLVGTWPGARRLACAGAAEPGQVCVRGGAYWMGQTDAVTASTIEGFVTERRLVVVSPFWIDRTEVTVGAVRPLRDRLPDSAIEDWSGSETGSSPSDWCTFVSDGSRDALPLNCVTWPAARDLCAQRGASLPTEAQFEYAASAFTSQRYVWGRDDPECGDAVFELGGFGGDGPLTTGACRPAGSIGGPLPPGSGERDRLAIDGVDVVDLAGNLREWVRDRLEPEDSACWPVGVVTDPACEPAKPASDERSTRGGAWANRGYALRAALRAGFGSYVKEVTVGFRCVRAGAM